ncbi:MAG: hypothetical protein JW751_08550 [Polyangiaceae bacterium]|nr:hypothetical protein [Polyangiaceae bacterium]
MRPRALPLPTPWRPMRLATALFLATGTVVAQPGGEAVPREVEDVVGAATPPSAAVDLARVEDLYRATSFSDCLKEAQRLLEPGNPEGVKRPTEVDRARTYLAACRVRSGDGEGGEAEFERAIRLALAENRAFPRPNSLVFSEEVVERFDAARSRLEAEIEGKRRSAMTAAEERRRQIDRERETASDREERLFDLASREVLIEKNRRWVAAMPFGVGQFQNRRATLGWVFLVSELAALGVAVAGISVEFGLSDWAVREGNHASPEEQAKANQAFDRARIAWVTGFYSLCGLAALGIAEAELRFVPEFRTERTRSLPDDLHPPVRREAQAGRQGLRLTPAPRGLGLGIQLSF